MGSFVSKVALTFEGLEYRKKSWDFRDMGEDAREKVPVDSVQGVLGGLICADSSVADIGKPAIVVTDPPYAQNLNYSELADFYYVWLRLVLMEQYPHFRPEYCPKVQEIVENAVRGKSRKDFYDGLERVFLQVRSRMADGGILAFTFHHTDVEGGIWEGLLGALCESGFEIASVYPIQGDSGTSTHHQEKENVTYDLIHVCRKRATEATPRSWAGIRPEVRRRARQELDAIAGGRYGKLQLSEGDVRLICIGKCLELYSAHYGKVADHTGKPLTLSRALQDISVMVDQLVSKKHDLPAELEDIDPLSGAWLRVLMPIRREVKMDEISKELKALRVPVDELKRAGLITLGRTGRGRSYEVKQPHERLEDLLKRLGGASARNGVQADLFGGDGASAASDVRLVDVLHLLVALAAARQPVVEWLDRFTTMRPQIRAALKYAAAERKDWAAEIASILNLIDGAPLLRGSE
jgi:hypothetical protein